MNNANILRIQAKAEDNRDGLFGQVLPSVFEILPYLRKNNLHPIWEIASTHYSVFPHGLVLPGAFDVKHPQNQRAMNEVMLSDLRVGHASVLGNDWRALSDLWFEFFDIPKHVVACSDKVGDFCNVLGIHYRGTDKKLTSRDTNPVNYEEYIIVIKDLLERNSQFSQIFVATDDKYFVKILQKRIPLKIINLGLVEFHKVVLSESQRTERTMRAVLDCYMLSKCKLVLTTSSALPSFGKIFNPDLEIYRIAASKLFKDTPYFPVAYIPKYTSTSQEISALIDKLMRGDWTERVDDSRFKEIFFHQPRLSSAIKTKKIGSIYLSDSENFKLSRNELCPCGSGKRYKHCHGNLI